VYVRRRWIVIAVDQGIGGIAIEFRWDYYFGRHQPAETAGGSGRPGHS
jgi:hypothetical protein